MSNVSRDKSVAKNPFGQLVTRSCTLWKFPDSKEMRLRLNDNNIVCDMCGKDNRKTIFLSPPLVENFGTSTTISIFAKVVWIMLL